MRRVTACCSIALSFAFLTTACSGSEFSDSRGGSLKDGGSGSGGEDTGGSGNGGSTSSAGGSGTGATSGSGGTIGAGGITGSGGTLGTGGTTALGGKGGLGSGGRVGTGGVIGAGGGSSGGATGTEAGTVDCTSVFGTFEKGCSGDVACALVDHQTDCCGSILAMGINHSEQTRFASAEATCSAQYPMCDCMAQLKTEDGVSVPFDQKDQIAVKCVNSVCQSVYTGGTFACGGQKCLDGQYCEAFVSGVPGGGTSYSCVPLPSGCDTCSCVSSGQISCTCTESGGHVFLTCYGV